MGHFISVLFLGLCSIVRGCVKEKLGNKRKDTFHNQLSNSLTENTYGPTSSSKVRGDSFIQESATFPGCETRVLDLWL